MDIRDNLDREKSAAEEILERNRCKEDLGYLCKDILGYNDWDTIHDEIQQFLKESIKENYNGRQYILIAIPRGHLKSCVVTKGWSIQRMLRNPNVRILIANAIWDNARGFLRTIMQYLGPEGRLAQLFGPFFPKNKIRKGIKWSANDITIDQRTIPQDAATITTTGVERTQASQHYDIIVLDDVVVRENINTPEQRDKIKKFYKDCIDLLEPNGIMIVVGTTWHMDDLYSAIPSEEDDFCGLMHDPDFKVFKRIAENGNQESVLFKNKFNFEELMKIKSKKGIYEYSAQYLLNPYPEEDMTFRSNWIKYWKYKGEQFQANEVLLPGTPLYVAITIDPSLGKENSNYAGIGAVGISLKGKKYVLEAKRVKRRLETFPDEIVEMVQRLEAREHTVNVIGLEYFGFQQSLLKPIKEALEKAGLDTPIQLLPPVNNSKEGIKVVRIMGLVPEFSNYEIFLHPTQKNLKEELRYFNPGLKNKYDDLLDMLAWNKVYWKRRPPKIPEPKYKTGSLEWWMRQRVSLAPDIFWEFRDETEIKEQNAIMI